MTDFDKELAASVEFMELIKDDDFAAKFYCSLENQDWIKGDKVGSHSFRGAGGLVADLRNLAIEGCCEDYLDWYCSWAHGYEDDCPYQMATIYPEVEEILNKLGWYAKASDRLDNARIRITY
jgi:hypothetical protein